MPLPRPLLLCLAIPPLTLAGQLGSWELASAASAAMAIDSALRRRRVRLLGWAGLALGAGLSGLILLPFVAALLIARRPPWRLWPILPVVAALLTVPTLPAPPVLIEHVPNLWALLRFDTLPMLGLACATTIGGGAAYIAQFSVLSRYFSTAQLLRMALLAALVVPILLPGLTGGAFVLAGLLGLALVSRVPDRETIETVAMIEAGVLLGILDRPLPSAIAAVLLIAAALRTAAPLLRRAANDNPILARSI